MRGAKQDRHPKPESHRTAEVRWRVLWFGFWCCGQHHDQKQCGEERLLAYRLRHPLRKSKQQELKQRLERNAVYQLCRLCYTAQAHLPRDGVADSGLDLPTSGWQFRECPIDIFTSQVAGGSSPAEALPSQVCQLDKGR